MLGSGIKTGMKTKVIHLVPKIHTGGGTIFLISIVKELRKLGISSNIFTEKFEDGYQEEFNEALFNYNFISFKNIFNWNFYSFLSFAIKNKSNIVIHSHGRYCFLISLFAYLFGIKTILQFHGYYGFYENKIIKNFFNKLIDQLYIFFSSKVIFCSKEEEAVVISNYNLFSKGIVVENRPRYISREFKLKNYESDKLHLICLSRNSPQKGLDKLFELVLYLNNVFTDFKVDHFLHFSSRQEKENLLKFINENDLSDTYFLKNPIKDPLEIFHNYDAIISTSIFEGKPLSILESMGNNLLVIATNCTGQEELVNMDKGIMLNLNENAKVWSDEIKKKFEDTSNLIKIQKNAFNFMQKIGGPDVLAKDILNIYREVTA